MNTTTAALQANVTTDTIRTWCRRNVIAATKTAGRWVIDTASLAARIAIGAMRARKAPAMSEPTEIRIDAHTIIRATQETSPAYGTTTWYAHKHVNGWKVGIPTDGNTAEEAVAKMRSCIESEREQAARIEALEESGLIADLTGTRTPGMVRQLDSLTVTPRQAHSGECYFCGLDARTCDCR